MTLQKRQPRVQVSPRIMIVAVPAPQHSAMFGQAASWQTVCRRERVDLRLDSLVLVADRQRNPQPLGLLRPLRTQVDRLAATLRLTSTGMNSTSNVRASSSSRHALGVRRCSIVRPGLGRERRDAAIASGRTG